MNVYQRLLFLHGNLRWPEMCQYGWNELRTINQHVGKVDGFYASLSTIQYGSSQFERHNVGYLRWWSRECRSTSMTSKFAYARRA